MTSEELLQKIGINFQVNYERLENIRGLIPIKGELFFLEDKKILVIGTGEDPVENLRGINFKTISYNSDDLISVLVAKMWLELELSAKIGERIEKFLPKDVLEEFIKQKPDNFTFFLEEEVPLKSPLRPFVKEMPNYAGAFFRNYNHGSDIDPNGNRDFKIKQDSAIQDHEHESGFIYEYTASQWLGHLQGKNGYWRFTKFNPIKDNPNVKFYDASKDIQIKGIQDNPNLQGKETRPINFSCLSLMRTE